MKEETTIEISNPEKVLFPELGLTKHDIVFYYKKISKLMLPYLKDRALALERFPDGINGERFYQKNIPDFAPKWLTRKKVTHNGNTTTYAACNNEASLLYLANLASISLHGWLSKTDKLDYPDKMIFDLDPEKEDLDKIVEVAKGFKFIIEKIGLKPFVMSTGKRGMHIVIPLDRQSDFKETRELAKEIAEFVMDKALKLLTMEQRIEKRQGKIYLDINRNAYAQLSVVPYSLRATKEAGIASPLSWKEIDDFYPSMYNIKNPPKSNPWKDFFSKQYSVKVARKKFEELRK